MTYGLSEKQTEELARRLEVLAFSDRDTAIRHLQAWASGSKGREFVEETLLIMSMASLIVGRIFEVTGGLEEEDGLLKVYVERHESDDDHQKAGLALTETLLSLAADNDSMAMWTLLRARFGSDEEEDIAIGAATMASMLDIFQVAMNGGMADSQL